MTDLRENLGWLVGSVATVIGVAISWFISSGIFTTLVAVLVGFLASYFLQTAIQKKAWKREYSVKIAETVYGALFGNLKVIIQVLEKGGLLMLGFGKWRDIQRDHRYFMVDERFRKKLDAFSQRAEKYSSAVSDVKNRVLPKIANEEANIVFQVDGVPEIRVKYVKDNRPDSRSPDIIDCLLAQQKQQIHPIDFALRNKSGISNVECFVYIKQRNGEVFHSHDLDKINEFWQSCLDRMYRDETYDFVVVEQENLLSEARKIMEGVVSRIEKPWKI